MLITILIVVLILYLLSGLGLFAFPGETGRILGMVLIIFLIIWLVGGLAGHPYARW